MTNERRDYVVHANDSLWEQEPLPGVAMDLLAGARQTEERFTLIRYTIEHAVLPHVHDSEDESVYVLEGEVTVTVGEREYELSPGSFVFMPKQVPHAIAIRSGPWKGLSVSAPGGVFDAVMEDAITLQASGAELTPEALAAIQAQHGVRNVSLEGQWYDF